MGLYQLSCLSLKQDKRQNHYKQHRRHVSPNFTNYLQSEKPCCKCGIPCLDICVIFVVSIRKSPSLVSNQIAVSMCMGSRVTLFVCFYTTYTRWIRYALSSYIWQRTFDVTAESIYTLQLDIATPHSVLKRLQSVQKAATGLLSPILRRLQLLVRRTIVFKTASSLLWKCVHGISPAWWSTDQQELISACRWKMSRGGNHFCVMPILVTFSQLNSEN